MANEQVVIDQVSRTAGAGDRALRSALEKVGRQALTQTLRQLSAQSGLTQTRLRPYVGLRAATLDNLSSSVKVKAHSFNVATFGGRQTRIGVRAHPWGRSQVFPHAFLIHGGATAMIRVGKARLPIRPLYGPRLTREFGLPSSIQPLYDLARAKFPGILAHELDFYLRSAGLKVT